MRGVARWFLPRPADGTAFRPVRCPRNGASGDASCDSGFQPPSVSLHTLLAALAYQARQVLLVRDVVVDKAA